MAAAQVLFATMNLGTRVGAQHLPWSEVAAARFAVGALLTALLARARGASLRITDRTVAWRRSIFGTFAAMGSFYALSSTQIPLGDAATLSATTPVFVALLSGPLLGERVGSRTWAAVLLAMLGLVAVVQPTFRTASHVAVVATAGAAAFAVALISLRRLGPGERGEAIVFHFSCVATVTFTLLSLTTFVRPSPTELAVLAGTGLAGGLAQLLMTRAYALDAAARVSALSYLGVVLTHVIGLSLLGDRPSPLQFVGTLLVVAAGLLLLAGAARTGDAPSMERR